MTAAYLSRLLEPPRQSFFLLGPRGSGKSTWARHELPEAHRIDLLDQAVYHSYLARPGQFADELRAVRPGTTVVVDEVQRVLALLNEVHRFIETGLAALLVRAEGAGGLRAPHGVASWPSRRSMSTAAAVSSAGRSSSADM